MNLDNLLRSKEVDIPELSSEPVTVYELSHYAQMLVTQANTVTVEGKEDHALYARGGPLTVKYGLQLEEPIEEIAEKMPMRVVTAVAGAITELMNDVQPVDEDVEGN